MPYLDQFKKLLTAGDAASANRVVEEALASGISPSRVYLNILVPAQIEHRKSAENGSGNSIAFSEMQRVRALVKPVRNLGVRTAVCALDNDHSFHKVSADCLFIDGWDIHILEPKAEVKVLVAFVEANNSQLVALSADSSESIKILEETIVKLRELSPALKIIIAGQIVHNNRDKIESLGPDAIASDPVEVVSVARKIFDVSSQDACLGQYLKLLGDRIVAARKLRRFSQQKLAQSASLDRAYISSVENGKQNVTIGAIVKLASALNLSLNELLVGK